MLLFILQFSFNFFFGFVFLLLENAVFTLNLGKNKINLKFKEGETVTKLTTLMWISQNSLNTMHALLNSEFSLYLSYLFFSGVQ